MNSTLIGAVDIGGSHITAALVDIATGRVMHNTWQRSFVPAAGTAAEIIDAWSAVIDASCFQQNTKPKALGIAMPGPFDYEQGFSYIRGQNKYEALYELNVKKLLAERLGIVKHAICFTNDAACFLQGEVVAGAASGKEHVVGITLGTGLGSAIYIDRKAQDAAWWNRPFREGIAEDHLSTRWFTRRYYELTGKTASNVKQLLDTNDHQVLYNLFNEFGHNLGLFLLQAIGHEPVQLVVLGGNIAHAFNLFSGALNDCLTSAGSTITVRKAILGEEAALIGAAAAAREAQMSNLHK